MFKQRNDVAFYFLILFLSLKVANGNVIFRIGFDFGINSNETSLKTILHIGDESQEEHHSGGAEAETFTTTAPILTDIWKQQAQLNATANDKLELSRVAVTQMKGELADLVGRSDYIANKAKLMTRYLHKVNAAFDNTANNRFVILQEFVYLVDELRIPPIAGEGGEKPLEYAVMKMALDKYKLIELQTQILVDVLQAMEIWQTYVQTQLIDFTTV